MDETQPTNAVAREMLAEWQAAIQQNSYSHDKNFIHSMQFYFKDQFADIHHELHNFGEIVPTVIEPLVAENHFAGNLPKIIPYNAIGKMIEKIYHHPSYTEIGNLIYGSRLLSYLNKPGGLLTCLSLFFLSSQAGEAGHNCPIACSAGIIRVLNKIPDFPNKTTYLEKLIAPSFTENFTGAQFLTEIQGGSDVGMNATYAKKDGDHWRIYGEKWFCSNANADLLFVTARYDEAIQGTKGLGLFLIPAVWENQRNHYTFRRLKDKLGTQTMATAEIDLHGAFAYPMGSLQDGFRLVMENVLHLSRLFNSFCVLGMAKRAYTIANEYAKHRTAFSKKIISYPLIKENLARIRSENTAMLAGVFTAAALQDHFDTTDTTEADALLMRLLVNLLKYLTANYSVRHIHDALGILAGNGTIETFSSLPRLLRDSIVCENWEGTHNVLRMQILKDIHRYQIDALFFNYLHDVLKQFDASSLGMQQLQTALDNLKKDIQLFKQLDEDLQTLQIEIIVDRMAVVFSACCLFTEAVDQFKKDGSSSKQDCLDYFMLIHLDKKSLDRNASYLNLITKISES